MNRGYWDDLAATYDQQIFSVLRHDRAARIAGLIEAHADPAGAAADLGCGPGQITPLLAEHFRWVQACDISEPLLDQARARCRRFSNIEFTCQDLVAHPPEGAPAGFVLCVNVLLTADFESRERLWNHVAGAVAHGGTLVLVVPSHESALYINFRRLDWNVRRGLTGAEAIAHSFPRVGNIAQLEHGVRGIEGVNTKHYLREEIIVQLEDRGLEIREIAKLTYDWTTEFAEPPDWLGTPLPWNWLVVAHRPRCQT